MKHPLLSFLAFGLAAASTSACDLCAVYSATHAQTPAGPGWSLSAATQFTHFATLRLDGDRVANPLDQRLDSTITQVVLRRGFTPRLSAQLAMPFIARSFHRPEGTALEHGHENGLGDISVLGRIEVIRRDAEDFTAIVDVIGGVKLPTGSSDRIAEELSESHEETAVAAPRLARGQVRPFHDGHQHAVPSGVHGHDLTLGTGSTDGIVGANFYFRHRRLLATGFAQYTLRTRGDYDYRFANDLTWEAAPGAYLILGHLHTLALQAVASGEHKGTDDLAGVAADDTGITSVFLGPRVTYTYGMRFSAAVGADFPASIDNTAFQLTPTCRLRANATWTF